MSLIRPPGSLAQLALVALLPAAVPLAVCAQDNGQDAVIEQQVQRSFPATALRGEIVVLEARDILLNGQPARLAPGARIRNRSNMIEMSGALAGQKLPVHYTVDLAGLVQDVWILRADELAKRPWPRTPDQAQQWQFDPAGQFWTKP